MEFKLNFSFGGKLLSVPVGSLLESKCYLITVTPVFSNGPGSAESVKAYLKQAGESIPSRLL